MSFTIKPENLFKTAAQLSQDFCVIISVGPEPGGRQALGYHIAEENFFLYSSEVLSQAL